MLMLGVVVLLGAMIASTTAQGASSSTVVTASVISATNINVGGCLPLTLNVTELGVVLPGSSAVTSSDCVVEFGSSNDTSMLRAYQTDGSGSAMQAGGNGALDLTYGVSGKRTHNLGGQDGLPSFTGGGLYQQGGVTPSSSPTVRS